MARIMKKPVFGWKNTIAALGFKVVWKNVGRSRRRIQRSQNPKSYQALEPRKLLAADTFVVNTLADEFDNSNESISLREAIYAAANDGSVDDNDIITFHSDLTGQDIEIQSDLNIDSVVTVEGVSGDQPIIVTLTIDEQGRTAKLILSESSTLRNLSLFAVGNSSIAAYKDYVTQLPLDQTGKSRIQHGRVDLGAVESSSFDVAEIVELHGLGKTFTGDSYSFGRGDLVEVSLLEGEEFLFEVTLENPNVLEEVELALDLGDGRDSVELVVASVAEINQRWQTTFVADQLLSYADDGIYAARLIATYSTGEQTTYRIAAGVLNAAPVVDIVASPSSVQLGQTVAMI
jgi:CSLREA domain-containing protein